MVTFQDIALVLSCYLVICALPVLCDDGAKNRLRYFSSLDI